MKKYIILLAITINQLTSFSQELTSKYKTGTIKLVPDKEYAQDNDWGTIFRSYYDTMFGGTPMGTKKTLMLLPDGSVIVNHAYREYHTKFSPTGKYEKEFTVEKAGNKALIGVINENTLFSSIDNMGNMICTDFNGKYKKKLKLDYMIKDIAALNNGKFAVVGWVIWTEKFRTFVSIVDYETNKEKVIWEHFSNRQFSSNGNKLTDRPQFNYSIKLKKGGKMSCITMPYTKETGIGSDPQLTTINNELIVAIPNTGEILVYDLDGNLKSKNKIDWPNNSISVEEQKAIQQKAIEEFKALIAKEDRLVKENSEAYKGMISEMEEDLKNINSPIGKPYFSNIIKDSDGNILFFEIPKEKGANVFHVWVYNQQKQFAAKCTFVCDEYDLNISSEKMVFKDGYIYALQTLKETKGNPLRLVRFKLQTK